MKFTYLRGLVAKGTFRHGRPGLSRVRTAFRSIHTRLVMKLVLVLAVSCLTVTARLSVTPHIGEMKRAKSPLYFKRAVTNFVNFLNDNRLKMTKESELPADIDEGLNLFFNLTRHLWNARAGKARPAVGKLCMKLFTAAKGQPLQKHITHGKKLWYFAKQNAFLVQCFKAQYMPHQSGRTAADKRNQIFFADSFSFSFR